MFYSLPFEYLYTPRVIVVTEEQLAAEKRRLKTKEVARLEEALTAYEATAQRDIEDMKSRLTELNTELEALPAAS